MNQLKNYQTYKISLEFLRKQLSFLIVCFSTREYLVLLELPKYFLSGFHRVCELDKYLNLRKIYLRRLHGETARVSPGTPRRWQANTESFLIPLLNAPPLRCSLFFFFSKYSALTKLCYLLMSLSCPCYHLSLLRAHSLADYLTEIGIQFRFPKSVNCTDRLIKPYWDWWQSQN